MNKINQPSTIMEHENDESTKRKQPKEEQKIKMHNEMYFFAMNNPVATLFIHINI
jgi:hypothetical protein